VIYGRVKRAKRALYQPNPNSKREESPKVGREHALALRATNEIKMENNESNMKNNESSVKNNESNIKHKCLFKWIYRLLFMTSLPEASRGIEQASPQ
jgi:hypothetical protein